MFYQLLNYTKLKRENTTTLYLKVKNANPRILLQFRW